MMKTGVAALAAILCAAPAARAQTAAEHVAMGDKESAALNPAGALAHYQEAIKLDSTNADALWKAARDAIDLGEFANASKTRDSLYHLAEEYATRGVHANPRIAETHFTLAKALGRAALTKGGREKVSYAGRVREEALAALKIDSVDDGSLHVLGVWNAEIMRLNGMLRFFAKNLLGGQVFGEANWDNARRYLERAVALYPDRIVHHLDLGTVYEDTGDKDKAREQYTLATKLPPSEYNDKHYQQQAEERLRTLR
jgi:tetratricopeptide (TPR) repeat protein